MAGGPPASNIAPNCLLISLKSLSVLCFVCMVLWFLEASLLCYRSQDGLECTEPPSSSKLRLPSTCPTCKAVVDFVSMAEAPKVDANNAERSLCTRPKVVINEIRC